MNDRNQYRNKKSIWKIIGMEHTEVIVDVGKPEKEQEHEYGKENDKIIELTGK